MISPGADISPHDGSNLTASQLMMWTGQKLQPDDPLYNMVLAFHIRGAVDPARFSRAFQLLIEQNDAMRTVITEPDGIPHQSVLEVLDYELTYLDFSGYDEPEAHFDQWARFRASRQLNMSERLFDSALIKLRDDHFAWLFNQHHVITDAWSVSLVFRAVAALYQQNPDAAAPAAQRPQFADYVSREAERRSSRHFARAAAHWQQQVNEASPPLSFYRRSPDKPNGSTRRATCRLGSSRTRKLRKLTEDSRFRAMSADLSLFQIFATVLSACLHRICQVETVVLGSPAHNRTSPKLKETIGPLIDMYPLRAEVGQDTSFTVLNQRLASETRQMLLNAAPGACSAEVTRSFAVVLNYITAAFGDFSGMPATSDWIHAGAGDRNHLLRLQVHDFDRNATGRDDEIVLHFDTNADAFADNDADRLMQNFLTLLDAMLADPDLPIGEPPLVSESELHELRTQLGGPRHQPSSSTVIDQFEDQAADTPEAIALISGSDAMTYRQLDAAASQVATQLQAKGVSAGTQAAIISTRSFDAVAAILGCLKRAVSYVPIDPDHPPGRVRSLLRGAELTVVITQQAILDGELGTEVSAAGLDVLVVDANRQAQTRYSSVATLNDGAYVIHTSGSTGTPKGVEVGHRALANYISWAARQYVDLRPGARPCAFPLFTSLAFDLTVTSIFVPLITGGTVVVYEERADVREITLQRVIEDNRVDVVKLTPAHLSLMQAMNLSGSRIRTLILGGEDLKADLARSVARRLGNVALYNEYGPTEATVGCTIHRFDPDADTGVSVPIGKAIDNAEIYLLDRRRNPVPRGVTGELFVGGEGVARGYLGKPDATAEKFVPNRWRPGELMYATGDLARLGANGILEYLGRNDHQVKIRGVRLELGEIEATLAAQPAVSEAVVVALDQSSSADAYCRECGLDARHPDAHLDEAGICRLCRVFAEEREAALAYFGTMDDLRDLGPQIRGSATGEQDCLMLLSGGKDSSYALCQVAALGFRPLVFTLDNGYISEQAKANARRICNKLGLELVVGQTPAMNEIFADSLARFSNVCNGCFKTIYTLSTNLAHERGIRTIITGLSRGQIFETRLAEFFKQRIFDPEEIDRLILEARKVYHRMDDAVCRSLDVSLFENDAVFDEVRFVDFYRYCDATLDEVYAYLATEAPWIRPSDTGRSTNCLINEVGIHVHKTERGYHNYALPYSWDVRLGHKQRDAARDELDDEINTRSVLRILGEINYEISEITSADSWRRRLLAYYVAEQELPPAQLKAALAEQLPEELLPHQFVRLDALPLTPNGKLDRAALPRPDGSATIRYAAYQAPATATERELVRIWENVLGVEDVGINDDFFDLGGDSILNIQIVALARDAGLVVSPEQVFEHTTIAGLAAVVGTDAVESEQGVVTGDVPLLPVQQRFFVERWSDPDRFTQLVFLESSEVLDIPRLARALEQVLTHHDGLRSRFEPGERGWTQTIQGLDAVSADLEVLDLMDVPPHDRSALLKERGHALCHEFDIQRGRVLRALCANDEHGGHLALAGHHLVVDAVSWWVILADLESAYLQLEQGADVILPPKTMSLAAWTDTLARWSQTKAAADEVQYWRQRTAAGLPIARDLDNGPDTRDSTRAISVSLTRGETRSLLNEVVRTQRVQIPEILLTALAMVLGEAAVGSEPEDELRIDLEGHGREELTAQTDLLRTTGWFTSLYPVCLPLAPSASPAQHLRQVREILRAVPTHGVGYGVLRNFGGDQSLAAELARAPRAEVLFNYLGQWDKTVSASSLFSLTSPIEISADGSSQRPYLFEINAVVFRNRLTIEWSYGVHRHEAATIQAHAEHLVSALNRLIADCLANPDTTVAPSDFPDAGISQQDLDALLDELGASDG